MKFLIVGDLHGIMPNVSKNLEFDAILCVGDFCGDKELSNLWQSWFKYLKKYEDVFAAEDLTIEKFAKKTLKNTTYDKLNKRAFQNGKKILKQLNSYKKPVFIVPGNWDSSYGKTRIKDMDKSLYNYKKAFYDMWLGSRTNPDLIKGLKYVVDCQYKLVDFEDFNIVGYGLVSGTEVEPKEGLKKEEYKKLKSAIKKIKDKLFLEYKNNFNKNKSSIFITHNIVYNTKLDIIKNKKSYVNKVHMGSIIARKFCEKYQPLLCIGGHIHEGRGRDKIGKTIVINPGFGENSLVLVEIKNNKIKKIDFLDKN